MRCSDTPYTLGPLRGAPSETHVRDFSVRNSRIGSIMSKRLRILVVGMAMVASMLATAGVVWAQEAGELPADPSGLVATAASTSEINLSWTDNATNEAAYVVERSLD